jgi:hypothetical protein
MTSTGSTAKPAVQDPAAAIDRMRGASMSALTMLILQFALGVAVNLYVTPRKGGVSEAFTNGALLVLHALLGLLLILAAIGALAQAVRLRHRLAIATSALGLVAILIAAGSGAGYLSSHDNGSSVGMALATAVAMFSYAVALRGVLPPQPVISSERPPG